jgi:hypothetical protein
VWHRSLRDEGQGDRATPGGVDAWLARRRPALSRRPKSQGGTGGWNAGWRRPSCSCATPTG